MKKQTTKRSNNAPTPQRDPLEEETSELEIGPPELQRAADGANHGHRMLSREEVIAQHGKETLHANEERADEVRQTRGHAAKLRRNHGR